MNIYSQNNFKLQNIHLREISRDVADLTENFNKLTSSVLYTSACMNSLNNTLKANLLYSTEISVLKLINTLASMSLNLKRVQVDFQKTDSKLSLFKLNINETEKDVSIFTENGLNKLTIAFTNVKESSEEAEWGLKDWVSLLADIYTAVVGIRAAMLALGISGATVFGPGGTIALGILGTLTLLTLFINEVKTAQIEAEKLDFIKKQKQDGTYWGVLNPGKVTNEQIDALKIKSEMDPAGTIWIEGKPMTNLDFYKLNEKKYKDQNTLPAPPGMIEQPETAKDKKKKDNGNYRPSYSPGNINIYQQEVNLLSTKQQILNEIEEIEKKIAIEDLPLQKKEFEKQIDTLRFRIRYLSGEFEKIDLTGIEAKTVIPDDEMIIKPRVAKGDKRTENFQGIKESSAFLKVQLGLIKSIEEAIPNLQNSFQGIFASFVPPQGAADPFREFMKQIVLTFLNVVEAMLFEAGAASFFKAVLTGGISLPKDVGLVAAGLAALEIAKGFVGGFAKGTDSLYKTGYALVGEQGPELVHLQKGTRIFNNTDTNKMLNSARANQPSSLNINNVYIASSLDALSFFRVNYPKYKKFKTLQAV